MGIILCRVIAFMQMPLPFVQTFPFFSIRGGVSSIQAKILIEQSVTRQSLDKPEKVSITNPVEPDG